MLAIETIGNETNPESLRTRLDMSDEHAEVAEENNGDAGMTAFFRPTRRNVLGLFAATSAVGLAAALRVDRGLSPAAGDNFLRWEGKALGANATLHIHDADPKRSKQMLALALEEIARLEKIFSLYRVDSALVQLNRDGVLESPPAELVAILANAKGISQATEGAFDVTVQPLWSLYQKHFSGNLANPSGPSQEELRLARSLVDHNALKVSPDRITLAKPGMAVTLNGIAQGEITDLVSDLLASKGLEHSLIDLGEMSAIGDHPEGRPWRVGLKDAFDQTRTSGKVELSNRALATSAVTGTVFDASGSHHHILDPATGASGRGLISASVIARRAATADALSTAMLASTHPISPQTLARQGAEQIITTDQNGEIRHVSLI